MTPPDIMQRIGEGFPLQRMVVLARPLVAEALRQPITQSLTVTDIGHFPKASGHYMERVRGVSQCILIYCTRGRGWLRIDGRQHEVHPGEWAIIAPSQPHAYGADEEAPWTIYWAHVAGANVKRYLEELGHKASRVVFRANDAPTYISALFEEALDALRVGFGPRELIHASGCFNYLLSRLVSRSTVEPQSSGSGDRVRTVIRYLQQNLQSPVTLHELAAMANLSPSHLAAVFKRQTGYPMWAYFMRLRIKRACELLDTTDRLIREVAESVGYDDPLHFSRAFRRIQGMSPSQYRSLPRG